MKSLFLLIGLVFCVYAGETITGKVIPSIQRFSMDENAEDVSHMRVTLNHGQYSTYPNKDGTFELLNVPAGRYLVEVVSKKFLYEAAYVEVIQNSRSQTRTQVQRIHPLSRKRPQETDANRPRTASDLLILHSIERIGYFEAEEELSLSSIVKNQYFFMIAMTAVMILLVKKMPMEELQSADRVQQEQ